MSSKKLPPALLFHPRIDEFAGPLREAVPELDLALAHDLAELKERLRETEILLCTQLPAEALAGGVGRLRWIQLTSAGVEGVLPVRELLGNVVVTNARGIHAELMSDYALAVMVMLQWDFPRLLRDQAERRWRREPKASLAGSTLGIVGPGAIGAEIGRRAAAFGMRVIGVRRSGRQRPPGFADMFASEELDDVLPQCDFVCIVVPDTPQTRGMFGQNQFRAMKDTAFLINISRGSLVDEPALIEALREKSIAGAGLDVFEKEPPEPGNPLWRMPNVIMSPHISGMMDVNAERVAALFADNLSLYTRAESLRNIVDLERGY